MTRQWITILLAFFAFTASAYAGGTVTLKGASRVFAGETLTLRDIARLDGDAQSALRDIPVSIDSDGGVVKLGLEDVRGAMRDAGIDPARFAINGSECTVRVLRRSTAEQGPAVHAVAQTWSPPSDERSFHARVMSMLEEHYGLPSASVRAVWQEKDHGFLDRKDENVRLVVEPITSGSAARAAILVRVWRDEAIIEKRTLRAEIGIKRTTCVSTREIRRGDVLRESDVRLVTGFERPDRHELLSEASQAVGQISRKTISEGVAIEARDIEPPILVERGQPVTLYCMRGNIEVRTIVRAKEGGVLGQLVEVQKQDSRSTIYARVDGPSRVVVDDFSDH